MVGYLEKIPWPPIRSRARKKISTLEILPILENQTKEEFLQKENYLNIFLIPQKHMISLVDVQS